MPILFVRTMGLQLFVPHARNPRLWGVPLVPWLPSASIAINFFLLGSIDKASYLRFGIWTGILMVYYLFFGLHLSYDDAKAKASRDRRMDEQLKVLEEVPAQEFVNVGNTSTLGAT